MSLNSIEIKQLRRLVSIAQKLLASADEKKVPKARASKIAKVGKASGQPKTRRTGRELAQFRKMLKSERRQGISVAEIASRHKVSTAYIYQLK